MRRKTKAKRIPDYENDEDEEEHQKLDAHGLLKRRKQMYPAKEKGEENASADTELQKFDVEAPECNVPSIHHFIDSTSSEEAVYLQSCSKMELIAMVLCMQKEMDNLKEQIRCLTACGKLARHLEALIERTQMWPGRESNGSAPMAPTVANVPLQMEAPVVPVLLPDPAVLNGQWPKQGSPIAEPHNVSHRSRLFTEFITPELLERCNTGTTAQKLTNDLLRGLYERDCLASHSISGVVYNKRGQPKPALPTEEVQAILRTVQFFFPGKTDAEIKGYIRQKLQNEAKRLRKKPSPSDNLDSRGLTLADLRAGVISTCGPSQRPSIE